MINETLGIIKITHSKNEQQNYTDRTINYFIPCFNWLPVSLGTDDIRQKILVELYELRCN
jgi:hypothetical protein